jgi:OFA family oxalate/formate antiporter-like MFS transporter
LDVSGRRSVSAAERHRPAVSLISMVAANAAAGMLFAWSVLLAPLSADLGVRPEELNTVFSSALVFFAVAVTVSGRAVDRHGPRVTTALAGVLSGLGLVVAGLGAHPLVLHAGIGALFGFGSGLTYLSVVAWASTGGQHRAWTVGVVVAAYAAGPVLGAPLGTLGAEHLGWRGTLITAGVVVASVIWVSSRGIPARRPATPADRPGSTAGRAGGAGGLVTLWVLFLGMFVPGLLAFAHAASIAVERGMSAAAAGGIVSVMALGNVAGRLLAAPLSTRLGMRTALWVTLAALALTLAPLAWLDTPTAVLLGLPVLGLQYGAASALLPMTTRAVSGEVRFATVYGRVFSSWGLAGVLGPTVVATLHQAGDGYGRAFQASLLAVGLAVPALVVLQRRLASGT